MKFLKKYSKITISLVIFAGFLSICYKLANYYSFAEEKEIEHKRKPASDTLKIIVIGDSWATYHSDYDMQLKSFLETKLKKNVTVFSKGAVGAKTKAIYANMYNSISYGGTKEMIDLSPDYAIISAGINDAIAKMGTQNYCHHYKLIINNLLSAEIKPIIIDMPQVDYKAVYKRENIIKKIRHQFSGWLTNAPLWSFDTYRKELMLMISQDVLRNQIIFIPSSEWNPKGYADPRQLYLEDHIHLNEKGYYLLDSCIASHIFSDIQLTHDFQ
jgi:lysophospholipase L1-like esterase